ncbi:hypothetical protein HaLaN_15694 [Haematococcus lacustris]|uniref:Uncharacterized protein n=1 Tax=Haematococcus lacustris TaxID=44745 RepID=A0A699ZHA8_HAELA|nr:hypothetical protein HaLaN_15694 [Haematococcus lacustris]
MACAMSPANAMIKPLGSTASSALVGLCPYPGSAAQAASPEVQGRLPARCPGAVPLSAPGSGKPAAAQPLATCWREPAVDPAAGTHGCWQAPDTPATLRGPATPPSQQPGAPALHQAVAAGQPRGRLGSQGSRAHRGRLCQDLNDTPKQGHNTSTAQSKAPKASMALALDQSKGPWT